MPDNNPYEDRSMDSNPSPQILVPPGRTWFFTLLFAVCLVFLTSPMWGPVARKLLETETAEKGPPDSARDAISLSLEARFLIGLTIWNEESKGKERELADKRVDALAAEIRKRDPDGLSLRALQYQLMFFTHLGWKEAEGIAAELKSRTFTILKDDPLKPEDARRVDGLIRRLYIEKLPLEIPDYNFLLERIGFFGFLARIQGDTLATGKPEPKAVEFVRAQAGNLAARMTMYFSALLLAGLIGFIVLAKFLRLAATGALERRLTAGRIPPYLLWEAFTLYLATMIVMDFAIGSISGMSDSARTAISLVANLLAPLVGLYPLTQSYPFENGFRRPSFSSLRADLGVARGEGWFREIGVGIAGYIATLPLMALATLLLYQVLRFTGMNQSEGMHPLVPALGAGKGSGFWVAVFFFMAVVAAPMIEEIFFRGFFYRFLRSRYDAPNAIFISAALFAGIHPQGMVGFFPLMAIGVSLAALREWRGSLAAPMVLHACVNGITMAFLYSTF